MVPSSFYTPTRHNRRNKTFGILATAFLALGNTNTLASASPAPIIVPPISGTELFNNGTTDLNSTTTVTIAPVSSIILAPTLLSAITSASATVLSIAISASYTSSSSFSTDTPSTPTPSGVLALPLKQVELGSRLASGGIARRYFGSEVLNVYSAAYLAQITFPNGASSPQVVDVLLDTGSFELFVNPVCSDSDVPDLCTSFGSYNASNSPTSKDLDKSFEVKYGSGAASGKYYKDSISLTPGTIITNQQFGVANASEHVWFGIMGLGQGRNNNYLKYPLVVDTLHDQGFTASRLFSLELGPQTPHSDPIQYSGEIVFGGLDRNKFAGNLVKVATNPREVYYSVKLASLTNNPVNGSPQKLLTSAITVIVDSGTTLSVLPRDVVESLAAQFSEATPDGNGGYIVPCSYRNRPGSVSFEFADITIAVSYRDFIWATGNRCIMGAVSSTSLGLNILGATFLRGAYVVFDQDNSALYMAKYQSCNNGASKLVPVPEGTDKAAQIVGACVAPPSSSTTTTSTTSTSTSTTTVRASSSTPISRISTSTSRSSVTGRASALATPTSTHSAGPDVTITSTITRPRTYTISSCTPGVNTRDCTVGALATTWEIFVTEVCLESGPDGQLIPHITGAQAGQIDGNGNYPTATLTTAGNQGVQGGPVIVQAISTAEGPVKETVTVTVDLNSDCAATDNNSAVAVLPVTAAVASPSDSTTCTDDEETTITVRPVTAAVVGANADTTTCDSSTLTIQGFLTQIQNLGPSLIPFPSDQFPYISASVQDTSTRTETRTATGRPGEQGINAAVATSQPSATIENSPVGINGNGAAPYPIIPSPLNASDVEPIAITAAGNSPFGTGLNTTFPSPVTAAGSQSAETLFAYTTMPDTVETVTASVIPIMVASGSDRSRGRGRRAGGRKEDGMWKGGVDVKIFVGVGVAVLGAWL